MCLNQPLKQFWKMFLKSRLNPQDQWQSKVAGRKSATLLKMNLSLVMKRCELYLTKKCGSFNSISGGVFLVSIILFISLYSGLTPGLLGVIFSRFWRTFWIGTTVFQVISYVSQFSCFFKGTPISTVCNQTQVCCTCPLSD